MMDFKLGQIVMTKKVHACGQNKWEVVRVGADIKLKCLNCSHLVMFDRVKAEKCVKLLNLENEND